MRLIVVGAGIAGSSVTRIARARGHHVTLVSRGMTASQAAVAVMRMGWHRGVELDHAVRSLALYREWKVRVISGADVTTYRGAGRRHDGDFHIVEPRAPLLTPDVNKDVIALRPHGITCADGTGLQADAVVDCRGVGHTEQEQKEAGLRPAMGATLVTENTALWTDKAQVRVHHIRPYHSLMAVKLPGQLRLGSSTGRTQEDSVRGVRLMLGHALDQGIVGSDQGWHIDHGVRARRIGRDPYLLLGELPAIRGLYRTGFTLGPSAAERLVSWLEARL